MSFRGTAAALGVFAAAGDAPTPATRPCATTIRSWVLRLGYAQLTRPLSHDHRWAWLVDHTLQIGSTKLLVIVGVPLDHVPFGVRPLQLADLHLVAMVPMAESNRARVDQELEKALARTGAPRQIIADGAADLQQGIERFRTRHPHTASVPDAAHHAANLLKHYWEGDPHWRAFTTRLKDTAATVRQTGAAYLLPPKLRGKARYMSAGALVRFGRIVLRKLQAAGPDPEVVRRYGWLSTYAESIAAWDRQYELVRVMLRQVRVEGLFRRGEAERDASWGPLDVSADVVSASLRSRLRAYVGRHGRELAVGERLVGSTEVLESAFGVQKRLSGDQSESGLTVLSVGLGAMLGEATAEQVDSDMDRVPEKAVHNWANRTFGRTVQWARRQFFRPDDATHKSVTNPG